MRARTSSQRDCGAVSLADHLIGWLFGLGILALAASALLWMTRQRGAQPAARQR
jgi:hypothetical protein